MRSDSDINKIITKTAKKTAGMKKTAAEYLFTAKKTIMSAINRVVSAAGRIPDTQKALAAVLVLILSLVVLYRESTVLRSESAQKTAGSAVVMEKAAAQQALQSAASEVLIDGLGDNLWDARARLESGINHETSSLRTKYMAILDRGEGDTFEPESETERKVWEKVREQRKEKLSEDPYLLLVNKWHYLPEDYKVDPVTLPNGQQISSKCYDELVQMLDDCSAAGGYPIVCSGYRPHEKQVWLYTEQTNRWLYLGYGQEEAEDLAATAVAIPGTSEHELGFAADIYSSENMSLDESQVYTFTQQWLMDNCWRYGFVLRYPKDKSDITGIIFEPWHYRYVGNKHAKKIHDAGICLEEYLDETEHPDEEKEDSEDSGVSEGTQDGNSSYN